MFQKGRSGNPGGRPKQKPWKEALERAVKRRSEGDHHALDRVADALINAAEAGDLTAIKELGDRLDGKAIQQQILTGDEDGGPVISRIETVIVDPKGK